MRSQSGSFGSSGLTDDEVRNADGEETLKTYDALVARCATIYYLPVAQTNCLNLTEVPGGPAP